MASREGSGARAWQQARLPRERAGTQQLNPRVALVNIVPIFHCDALRRVRGRRLESGGAGAPGREFYPEGMLPRRC